MIWEIKSRFSRNKVIKFFRSDLVDNYKFRDIINFTTFIMVCYNYCIEVISMMWKWYYFKLRKIYLAKKKKRKLRKTLYLQDKKVHCKKSHFSLHVPHVYLCYLRQTSIWLTMLFCKLQYKHKFSMTHMPYVHFFSFPPMYN